MEFLVQQLVNGLTLGIIYALIAIGFSLFFGVLDLVHFAHGDVAMFGAYSGLTVYLCMALAGVNSSILLLFATLTSSIIATCVLGVVIERTVIRPLIRRNAQGPIILLGTVGVTMIIRESIRLFYPQGSSAHAFPGLVSNRTLFSFGDTSINLNQVFIWVAAMLVFYIVYLIINRTTFGMHLRAVAQNKEVVAMMGVNVNRTILFTFVLGSALAAVAGYFNGMYYQTVRFDIGLPLAIKGFSAAVVGGLGNIYGSILGALLMGFAEVCGSAFVPGGSQNKDIITFLLIIGFLVFRPSGIIGEKIFEKV